MNKKKSVNKKTKRTTTKKRKEAKVLPYRNARLSVEARVKDLLSRMTLEEKVDQLRAFSFFDQPNIGWEYFQKSLPDRIKIVKALNIDEIMKERRWGHMCILVRDLPPYDAAEKANDVQEIALENTRLGIPVIIHDEGLHGLHCNGATSFPQSIGMAASWQPELLERVASIIGKESRARGITQLLSPTINIARDPRCGRTEETYGEDPYLAARLAAAYVRGLQRQRVAATPKHYAANFVGDGGRDSNAVFFSEQLMRETYFPAFKAAVKDEGALSLMAAYGSWDRTPCSCSYKLLTDILRNEWGFKGFVVSDYGSVMGIKQLHCVAATEAEAGKKALEAGLDVELPSVACFNDQFLKDARKGKISKKAIDRAVSCILKVKFLLGLFDEPYCDPEEAVAVTNTPEHRKVALEMARQSIVLLKNDKNILPLKKNILKIAVIGPNADEIRLGGYTWNDYTRDQIVTPLQGIRSKVNDKTTVLFVEGCKVRDTDDSGFRDAISIARKSDVAILVLGNSGQTEGEARDRADLNLPGIQEELIKRIVATRVPTVVVLINGSAITMKNWINDVQAVVEAWYPGEQGGNAIADVLFGDYNPGGKLPVTFPQHVGQLPLYYNPHPTGRGYDYIDMTGKPLFPFGYGLSYTSFDYSNLRITPKTAGKKETITVSFTLTNKGSRAGDEVVQMYIRDLVAGNTRPLKSLMGFKRLSLASKESTRVSLTLKAQDLGYYNDAMKYIVEPGEFEVMIGSSSEDIKLRGSLLIK